MKATKKKSAPKEREVVVVNVKMLKADHEFLLGLAQKWAGENLSAWIRHSSRRYVPKKGERIKLRVV